MVIPPFLPRSSEGVRLVVLVAFCSQGDNTGDAKALVAHLNQWMELCSGQGEPKLYSNKRPSCIVAQSP